MNLWQIISRLFWDEGRIAKLEATLTKLGDDVSALENIVPQVIAQSQADQKKAATAQALADEAKAELATAEDPDTIHRLDVQIEALNAFVASRAATTTALAGDTTATPADTTVTVGS